MNILGVAGLVGLFAAQCSALELSGAKLSSLKGLTVLAPVALQEPVPARMPLSPVGIKSDLNYFEELSEEYCPRPTILKKEDTAVCKVTGAFEIYKAKVERKHQIANAPVSTYGIVDLGIWPDDSTNHLFSYDYELFSAEGKKIGYATMAAYENSEMGVRTKLLTRYTLKGALAAVTVVGW